MGVNSLPKTVTRQRRGCDLNPGRSVPESSTLNAISTQKVERCSPYIIRCLYATPHVNTVMMSPYRPTAAA